MIRNRLSAIVGGIVLILLSMNSIAQSNPASPADPSVAKLKDPHLNEAVEDLTSPTLEKTHLIPDRCRAVTEIFQIRERLLAFTLDIEESSHAEWLA